MPLAQRKNATAEAKTCIIQVLDVGTPGSFLMGQLSGRQEEFVRDGSWRKEKLRQGRQLWGLLEMKA